MLFVLRYRLLFKTVFLQFENCDIFYSVLKTIVLILFFGYFEQGGLTTLTLYIYIEIQDIQKV